MNIKPMLTSLLQRLVARRRYKQALTEIQAITNRELADMGIDRATLRQRIETEIYR